MVSVGILDAPAHTREGRQCTGRISKIIRLSLCLLVFMMCPIFVDAGGDAVDALRDARIAAEAFELQLPRLEAAEFSYYRSLIESAFEAEREVRRGLLEAKFDKSLSIELKRLVLDKEDFVVYSGLPDIQSDLLALESEIISSSHRRLHDEAESPDLVVCDACKEETKELMPMWMSLPIIAFLVTLSGLFSGLTLGLMGLDMTGLQIVAKGDNATASKSALKIMPVREKGNQLLCTLLLGNVAVNSALSILTAELFSGLVGFFASTSLIVVFGEILPQAACSRYALQVGACTVPLVNCLMGAMYILTKPMSLVLDCILGSEVGTVHSRTELMEMLKLHINLGAVDSATGDMARQVAEGALSFRDKEVNDVMTPLEDAYMLQFDTVLGYNKVREIFETGYSRIPIYGYDKHDYKGLLYSKDLMLADPEDEMKVGDFINIFGRKVETLWKTTKLVECLNLFKKGGTHMGLVRTTNTEDNLNPSFSILGVLTLEDVMEEILQEEIIDETDVFVKNDREATIKVFGRERKFDLAVFNPVWRDKAFKLSIEEVSGIAAHLRRHIFNEDAQDPGGLSLSADALLWLVSAGEVVHAERKTPIGHEEPYDGDFIFRKDMVSEFCALVLQGRITIRVGREQFRSEAGAFSLLAKDALRSKREKLDFDAYLSTLKVRYLIVTKKKYHEARKLDLDPVGLKVALANLKLEAVGAISRKEARVLQKKDATRDTVSQYSNTSRDSKSTHMTVFSAPEYRMLHDL